MDSDSFDLSGPCLGPPEQTPLLEPEPFQYKPERVWFQREYEGICYLCGYQTRHALWHVRADGSRYQFGCCGNCCRQFKLVPEP